MENTFTREDRYIVIKRKGLNALQQGTILHNLRDAGIEPVQCVVVESDWPEYETVWQMINARVSGRVAAPTNHERVKEALRQFIYETTHLSPLNGDGSHDCRISAECLENGRAALATLMTTETHPASPDSADARGMGARGRADRFLAALETLCGPFAEEPTP